FELTHLLAGGPGRRVPALRSEVTDRVVSPVVDEVAFHQLRGIEQVVHRHQFHRGDTDTLEVLYRSRVRQTGVRATERLGDVRVAAGETLDVELVDDRVRPGSVRPAVVAPRKRLVDNDASRHRGCRVEGADSHVVAAEAVTEQRTPVAKTPRDGARV